MGALVPILVLNNLTPCLGAPPAYVFAALIPVAWVRGGQRLRQLVERAGGSREGGSATFVVTGTVVTTQVARITIRSIVA